MIDLHSHVLPGIDDGPPDLEGSLALARAAVAAGTHVMAATPHIGLHYDVAPHELPERVRELRRELAGAGVPLELVVGGELATSRAAHASEGELRAIALGGRSCVLLECPFARVHGVMSGFTTQLQRKGFRVLLAHPERSPEFLSDPPSLGTLLDAGNFMQITAGSLRGDFGKPVRRFSLAMLEQGLVHVVASDAHDAVKRPPDVLSIVRDAVWELALPAATTGFLTEDAPRALLEDEPLPPRPQRRRRRFRRQSRGR